MTEILWSDRNAGTRRFLVEKLEDTGDTPILPNIRVCL